MFTVMPASLLPVMTFYARILELHPEYEGMRAADLAAQGMACPAERSAELLGNDGAFCEMENRTPGRCMKCQMNFLTAAVPEMGNCS